MALTDALRVEMAKTQSATADLAVSAEIPGYQY